MSKISEDEAVDALDEKQLESMGYTQQLKVRLRCVAPAACLRLLNPPPSPLSAGSASGAPLVSRWAPCSLSAARACSSSVRAGLNARL